MPALSSFGNFLKTRRNAPHRPIIGIADVRLEDRTVPATFFENFDGVSAPALPAGWTVSTTGAATPWKTTVSKSFSPSNSVFADNPSTESDNKITSPLIGTVTAGSVLSFRLAYDLEGPNYDGAILEISTNGGITFNYVPDTTWISGKYNQVISTGWNNPIGGLKAWTGNFASSWIEAKVPLTAYAGNDVMFRWRVGTDSIVPATGIWLDDVQVTNLQGKADLSVDVINYGFLFVQGQNTTFEITAQNFGPFPVTGATLTSLIPPELDVFAATWTATYFGTASGPASGTGNLLATINLAPGDFALFEITAPILAGFGNTITLTADIALPFDPLLSDPVLGNNSDSFTTAPIAPTADLQVTTDNSVTSAVNGNIITYTITFSNLGGDPVTGVSLTNTFPSALSGVMWNFVSATGGAVVTGDMSGTGVLNSFADLPSGSSVTFVGTGTVDTIFPGIMQNIATLAGPFDFFDPDVANNIFVEDDIVFIPADLSIAVIPPTNPLMFDQTYTWLVTVTNKGPNTIGGTQVTDAFTSGFSNQMWSVLSTTGSATVDGPTSGMGPLDTFVTLSTGDTVTFTVTAKVAATAPTAASYTATLVPLAGLQDPTTDDQSSVVPHDIVVPGDLSVTYTNNTNQLIPGSSTTYVLTFINKGTLEIPGISVINLLPAGAVRASWMSILGDGASLTGPSSGTDNLLTTLTLAPGGQAVFVYVVDLPTTLTNFTSTATFFVPSGYILGSTPTTFTETDPFIVTTVPTTPSQPPLMPPTSSGTPGTPGIPGMPGTPPMLPPVVGPINPPTKPTAPVFFAVGAGAGGGPHVRVINATTGETKFSFFAYDSAYTGGVRVAMADVNGDGVEDIITGTGFGGGPHIKVFNGNDLSIIREFFAYAPNFFGGVFLAAGDIDGDGFAEIVTSPDFGGGPHIQIFDGRTGNVRNSFFAFDPDFRGGANLSLGDIDGDGILDLVVGAGRGGGPRLTGFRSADPRRILFDFFAGDPGRNGGVTVALADVDGNGIAELITAAGPGSPRVIQYLTPDLKGIRQQIAAFESDAVTTGGDPRDWTGVNLAVRDLDGDGKQDIIAASGLGSKPEVRAFRGSNGSLLFSLDPYTDSFLGGVFIG